MQSRRIDHSILKRRFSKCNRDEFVELEQALEEIDLFIEEQGSDSKAILLELEPAGLLAEIREKCLRCH